MLTSTPFADVVENVYAALRRKKPGDLRQIIREHIQLAKKAKEARPLCAEAWRIEQIADAANRAHAALVLLREKLKLAGIVDERLDPGSTALLAVNTWCLKSPDPRADMEQRVSSICAILIIEACSDEPPRTTKNGNLHTIMRLVHRDVFGPLEGKTAGLSACQKTLRWHLGSRDAS